MRRRRSESPPLRRARAPPPRILEAATQKVTRKIAKDRALRGATVDVDQVYERQQENAQLDYEAFEAELRRNFEANASVGEAQGRTDSTWKPSSCRDS